MRRSVPQVRCDFGSEKMGRSAHDAAAAKGDLPSCIAMRRLATSSVLVLACALAASAAAAQARTRPLLTISYDSPRELAQSVRGRAVVVRTIPALHVAEIRPLSGTFERLARRRGAAPARVVRRVTAGDPALFDTTPFGLPFEWQFGAVHLDGVPTPVLRAAASVTIAVIDTGADLSAPDLAAKAPRAYNMRFGTSDIRDLNGHGTFVSSLAAGSVTNGVGIAGFGGDARLLVIKASRDDGTLSDFDEASAIVYAVEHGARIINLSVGGTSTSFVERRGIDYAAEHGVLVVAAAGNEYTAGNPVEYPAALLQPVGSDGRGGVGLAVGASTSDGTRASFSNTGSQLSLLAPGDQVFGAVSSLSPADDYPRSDLPDGGGGLYGYASGTSFASPEVAGAAALVMAANPLLRAPEVAQVLKQTASNHGSWSPDTGYGVLDVAAAVAAAQGHAAVVVRGVQVRGHVKVRWSAVAASHYRVTMRIDATQDRTLYADTTKTSTSVRVRRGHRYMFTVTTLDGGSVSATYSLRAR
jgi:subtilisin family serine protease